MADQTLTVKIVGDESDLLRAFQRSTRATQRFSVGAGSILKGAIIFEGVRLGVDLITTALRTGISEFAEMQTVAAQTQAVLKSTGGVANVTAQDVDRLATSLSRLSGSDDEAIASSANLLLTFKNVRNELGAGNRVFDRAALAALNLSKAAGGAFGSLDTTAKQLGKALNDPVRGMTALSRAGITFSDAQKETIKALVATGDTLQAQKLILREVESQVGGSAKAFGETLPGQLAKVREAFRNAFGNLVAVVATPLSRALGAFAEFIPRIEEGVQRISSTVGPALNDVVSAFVDRLPEIRNVSSSILDPLRDNVFPILREFAEIAARVWSNVLQVFNDNSDNLRNILTNVGQTLQAVWTVARPTIVFLFETVLPNALRITIPILEKVTEVVRFLAEVFTRSVSGIIQAIDKFLGGLSTLADAASHLPFIGDSFKGIADQINAAREDLRAFSDDLDALNGKKAIVAVGVELPGRRAEGPAQKDEIAAEFAAKNQTVGVTKGLEVQRTGAQKIEVAAKAATVATVQAKTAAEKQREAFQGLLDVLSLRQDRAEETLGLTDDLRVAEDIEDALLAQIKVEGRTTDLLRQLQDIRQQQMQLHQQQRRSKQFEALGLTAEGDARVPGAGALGSRAAKLEEQIKGTALDTPKTQRILDNIGKVLSGSYGKLGRDVRRAILAMLNAITEALKDGTKQTEAAAGGVAGEITPGGIRSTQMLLRGLNLTDEERRAIQQRNLGVSGRRGISAFGFTVGGGAATSGTFRPERESGGNIIVQHLTVVSNDPNDMMKKLQKKARRSSGGRRGRHGGANLGMQ